MPDCSANTETLTLTNYATNYINSSSTITTSCLPNSGAGWTTTGVNSATGLVETTPLDAWVVTLIAANNANAPSSTVDVDPQSLSQTNTDPAKNFSTNAATLRRKISLEYCYYYVRYRYALTTLLTQAVTPATDFTSTAYTTLKTNTETLNRKLNQIIQIIQSLANNRLSTLNTYYGDTTGINIVNTALETTREALFRDSRNLKDSKMESNVKNAMMDYTIEKNNSSRNLLAIYGFLNIVAIGTIFYLYKNARE